MDLGNESEGMIRLLVISLLLPLRQLDLLTRDFFVSDLTQQVRYHVQTRPFLVVRSHNKPGAQDVSVAANISSRDRE